MWNCTQKHLLFEMKRWCKWQMKMDLSRQAFSQHVPEKLAPCKHSPQNCCSRYSIRLKIWTHFLVGLIHGVLRIGLVHSFDTCCWSDMDGPNSLPDSNSSGSKTESNIWREQLLFAELAPSIFRTFNLMRGLRASVGFHFKSTPSREIFKFSNRLK